MIETGKRRPWWAVAMAGGFGAILGAGTLLGLNSKAAHSEAAAATVALAAAALPPGSISLDERLRGIEQSLKSNEAAIRAVAEDVTEVKRRLPDKP